MVRFMYDEKEMAKIRLWESLQQNTPLNTADN